MTYPNGQTSAYSYLGNLEDRRLQTIHHKYPTGATLSKFDYTYDVVGNILTWRQQADATAVLWRYGYDPADQLTAAIKESTDPTPTVLKRYGYAYDPAGNRTVEQIDDVVTGTTYDNMNRLVSQQPSGALRLEGTVSEPATVSVAGKPLDVSGANRFTGSIPITSGTTPFTITATDASGNTSSKAFEVDSAGTGRTFTFDANGNMTSDGTRTFEWDARNQLVAVTVGTHRSEFTYDGQQRRVRVVEKDNGVTQSDSKVVWCRREICEERGSDGVTVARRSFSQGEQPAGTTRFFVGDRLGSLDAATDASGGLLARYALDPWGRRTLTAGGDVTNVGYAGHRWQPASSLSLTLYRAYDTELGRWISEDPSGYRDGVNLFLFVKNSPIRYQDSNGLWAAAVGGGWSGGGAAGPFGLHVEASCQLAFDGKGGLGLYCCGAAGPAVGLGGATGPQGAGTFCYGCKSICDMPGLCAFVQLVVAEGLGGSIGGGISRGSGPTSITGSVGGKGGFGGYLTGGVLCGCYLIPFNRSCDSCD